MPPPAVKKRKLGSADDVPHWGAGSLYRGSGAPYSPFDKFSDSDAADEDLHKGFQKDYEDELARRPSWDRSSLASDYSELRSRAEDEDEDEEGGSEEDEDEYAGDDDMDAEKGGSPNEEQLDEEDDLRSKRSEMYTLSFGALAEAQDALGPQENMSRRQKAGGENVNEREGKLQGLRDRLAELREKKTGKTPLKPSKERHIEQPSDHHRSSKHAPTEQTSRKQVTRRRDVVDTSHLFDAHSQHHKLQGDPRFNAAGGGVDREKMRRNYGFLNEYAQKELQELKTSLDEGKKRKRGMLSEDEQANLRKEIVRRENRMKADAKKDREREIATKHKQEERQKVKEGKTPYYLKRGQIKEKARNEAWEGMKKKDQEKSEQKKRRKQEAKEMKRKPNERRVR